MYASLDVNISPAIRRLWVWVLLGNSDIFLSKNSSKNIIINKTCFNWLKFLYFIASVCKLTQSYFNNENSRTNSCILRPFSRHIFLDFDWVEQRRTGLFSHWHHEGHFGLQRQRWDSTSDENSRLCWSGTVLEMQNCVGSVKRE